MRPIQAPTIHLSEYRQPPFWIKTIDLNFSLHPTASIVRSTMEFTANDLRDGGLQELHLHGQELKLLSASINSKALALKEILIDAEGLTIPANLVPQGGFTWQAEVEINPEANSSLNGLYMSNGMYCTQCEAEGFRKITFSYDRPDVMSVYTVTIESDAPVLLSNGNKIDHGKWRDPWPKPSYLFALVAGDLVAYTDTFTTMSGRDVTLEIWVRPGDQNKCAYAMDSLKRSMRWDETEYGREYDLDLFMIVAVDDFNMGAMENKGLNIFNSKYVLASPETATDRDYELIEGIIAHEYFHNWTGNRITCRDWFQLCLKEGLTVFRDQQFSGDERSRAVVRIENVLQLRGRQFREDAGPLAHSVRPEEYIEINNFYTATIYEKGAELIGMLRTLVGAANYRKALDLYFERHDNQACTIEHWIKVFEDACDTDLSQFALWYTQAGTPKIDVNENFEGGTLTIKFTQINPNTPGQKDKRPQVIPIRTGFLTADGSEAIPERLFTLTSTEQSFKINGLSARPTVSYLRNFSAPVILNRNVDNTTRAFLFVNDNDLFNRWEEGRNYAVSLLRDMANAGAGADPTFIGAMRAVAANNTLDPAFRALTLALPSEEAISQAMFNEGKTPEPDAIYSARAALNKAIATEMADDLPLLYASLKTDGPYTPNAAAAGKRALRAVALSLLSLLEHDCETARAQFATADNMTEQFDALSTLITNNRGADAISIFYEQWKHDRLVIDKWFTVQVSNARPTTAVDVAKKLSKHQDFDWKNPNRFRSLISGFAMMNPAGFHNKNGCGYAFFADWLIKLDPVNPQTTARMCGGFETWRRYDVTRQKEMRKQLTRIAATPNLSKDTSEITGKILGC
ncbi:MAG: aminopeptidase N [Amylibacter sp.]|nr:aminopeptidase N [Amylibacter sp.]